MPELFSKANSEYVKKYFSVSNVNWHTQYFAHSKLKSLCYMNFLCDLATNNSNCKPDCSVMSIFRNIFEIYYLPNKLRNECFGH